MDFPACKIVSYSKFKECHLDLSSLKEGGVRVCGDAVLRYIWCGFAVISILTRGIAVSKH